MRDMPRCSRIGAEVAARACDVTHKDDVYHAWHQRPLIHKSLGDDKAWLKALDRYITHFRRDPKVSAKVFTAHRDIARYWRTHGHAKRASKRWRRILREFRSGEAYRYAGLTRGRRKRRGGWERKGGAEATIAAEAAFRLLESDYDRFMATRLVASRRLTGPRAVQALQRDVSRMMQTLLGRPPGKPRRSRATRAVRAKGRKFNLADNTKVLIAAAAESTAGGGGLLGRYTREVDVYGSGTGSARLTCSAPKRCCIWRTPSAPRRSQPI